MNITYLEQPNNKKLFSFFTHDYKKGVDNTFIDGGFDYIRFNGKLGTDTIDNLIEDIREQFLWGRNYDENNNRLPDTEYILLKDLTTPHIIRILQFFTKNVLDKTATISWTKIHYIFLSELYYRLNNQNQ